jgi:hypothetical protein
MGYELYSSARIDQWQEHGPSQGCRGPFQHIPQKVLPRARTTTRSTRSEVDGKQRVEGSSIAKNITPEKTLTIADLRKGRNLSSSKLPFLWKLHEMLDDVEKTGNQHIVSWLDHGRKFRVNRPRSFVQNIIPFYFKQSKYKSFQRQLHLYEFKRTPRGPEAGAYSHPQFVRGVKTLCLSLSPKKIKGKLHKQRMATDSQICRYQSQGTIYPSKVTSQQTKTYEQPAEDPSSNWMAKIEKSILVTGASLAVEIEEQSRTQGVAPHDGDIVYAFGGMPFRYLDSNQQPEPEPDEEDFDDVMLSESGRPTAVVSI